MQIVQEKQRYQHDPPAASDNLLRASTHADDAWLEAYLDHIRSEKALSSSTMLAYASDLARFSSYVRGQQKSIASVTEEDILAWFSSLKTEGMSSSAQARKLSSLRGYFRFLLQEKQLGRDPTAEMAGPKPRRLAPQTLTFGEVELLLSAPDRATPRGVRDHAMIQLLYASGLRVSELVGLGLGHVDLAECSVLIPGRGSRHRVTPCGETARNALAEYLHTVRPHWLKLGEAEQFFVTERGRGMTRQGFWKLLGRYARTAGIEQPISPHKIRHSFAAHLLQQGADLRSVQTMLGNADAASMYPYYGIVSMSKNQQLRRQHKRFHPIG